MFNDTALQKIIGGNYNGVRFRMLEETLFVMLGLLVAFNVGHLLTLKRCETALYALTIESKALTDFKPSELIEQMKEETLDLVHDVMGQMKTPSIADHLGGVVAQFAQMRMMRMLQSEGMMPGELDFEPPAD